MSPLMVVVPALVMVSPDKTANVAVVPSSTGGAAIAVAGKTIIIASANNNSTSNHKRPTLLRDFIALLPSFLQCVVNRIIVSEPCRFCQTLLARRTCGPFQLEHDFSLRLSGLYSRAPAMYRKSMLMLVSVAAGVLVPGPLDHHGVRTAAQ